MPTQEYQTAQFSLRSLFVLTLAVSVVLALWRATGSAVVLLVGSQLLLAGIVYLDFRVAPEDFNCLTGCAAILAIILLPWLFGATVLIILYELVQRL